MEWNQTSSPPIPAEPTTAADDEISLLGVLVVLARQKRLLITVPLVCAVLAAILSLFLHNIYTAETKLLPPQQSQSSTASALLGQLTNLGPLAGLAATNLGVRNPSQIYVAMLKSRSVADGLIKRFDLYNVYGVKRLSDAEAALADISDITADKEGVISVQVDDRDPKRAAAIANAYVDELRRLTVTLGVSEASQRRLFFERELRQAKDELANAEVGLKQTQEATGLIQPEGQARAIIETVASLSRQIAAKEVQIRTMRAFATSENPDLVRNEQELAGLRAQLSKLEEGQRVRRGDVFVSTANVPSAGLDYIRKYRDVKYHEAVFEILARQYEIARLDESRDLSQVQVLDQATPPDKKSRPKRSIIVLLTAVISGFLTILGVLIREAFQRAGADPRNAEHVATLKNALQLQRRRFAFRPKSQL